MDKDLKQAFLQSHINKAKVEIAKVLENHNLLLSAELQYNQGAIIPIIKLVERKPMSEENQPVETPVEETPIEATEPAAQAPAEATAEQAE